MSQKTASNALPVGYALHWYVVQSILGQGGFGITYLARDNNLDQLVAIKEFLPPQLANRGENQAVHPLSEQTAATFRWGRQRFLEEARTLARFRHPNIVQAYSVFEANGTAYLVMDYERGESLRAALAGGRLAGEPALRGLLLPLLDGVEHIHRAGYVHRDIKPDNIYLRADGQPVLLDFGSARLALGVETHTLTSLVSPGYAPFEQYNDNRESDRQGPWTDIYALAACLYRVVTGRGPVDAVSRAHALLQGGADPLRPAAELAAGRCSPAFLAAIDRGLAFAPEARPQSIAQWRPQFDGGPAPEGATAAGPTSTANLEASPTVLAERHQGAAGAADAPRSRSWRGLLGALLLGLAAVGAARWWLGQGSGPDEPGPARVSATLPPPPPLSASALEAVLAGRDCLLVGVVRREDSLLLQGFAAAGALDRALAGEGLARHRGVDRRLVPVDEAFCPLLGTYGGAWRANRSAGAPVGLEVAGAGDVLRVGEPLVLALAAPPYESAVYLDYFSADGQVVHLLPGPRFPEHRMAAGQRATVGDLDEWLIGPPYGREMLVALFVPQPLELGPRPEIEAAGPYLELLQRALAPPAEGWAEAPRAVLRRVTVAPGE